VQLRRVGFPVRERRACQVIGLHRTTQHDQRSAKDHTGLLVRRRDLTAARVRYGYRRLHVWLQREGWRVNHQRVDRRYRLDGLSRRVQVKKKRTRGLRVPIPAAQAPNAYGRMDFMTDRLCTGQRRGAVKRRCSSFLGFMIGAGVLTILLFPCPSAAPAETPEQWVARAVSVQGVIELRRVGETLWQPVRLHDAFRPGDTIRVSDRSRANVALLDQSVFHLNANTTITFRGVQEERTGLLDLLRGAAHFFSRGPRSLEVRTPFATAGIRGTEFFISVEAAQTFLSIFEGTVVTANEAGSLMLAGGQSAVAEAGKAPVLRIVARPRDAVHWALYYPPVLYVRPEEFPPGPDWPGMVRRSIEFYLRGDLPRAFDSLAHVPPDIRDPRVFTYRAHLLLAVGRADEANADIARALRLAPNDPQALALHTIIAVVQNDKDQALQLAQQAVQAAPHSATAHIALSYAQQARFDLEGARASLEQAVQLEPKNALAWARLAELHASFGELKKALKAAQQAVALESNLARTQTVLGFAYLMQVKTARAKEAFDKAIVLDQADPLPRLGLGLAKIRESDLDEGSRDIEIAASLDPNNALVRSYLGKAYYEEKHIPLDEREYKVAKELDPNDPTPWFYDAIAKQTTNRPVEALHSLEKAIELNDNRAVYRSRLLLDADLAARSASLARIYSDLGFQQLALVEGWKSVNTDPTNFSAHRFLADSYAVLPRHEIARVSELLQSQLLQPINLTPIQPRLAESNLFLISAGGPGALSFHEFNPLFTRNRVALLASGLAGENSTYAGEGVIAGIYKNASFSLGGGHFTTDGFRRNADQKDDIANAFVQMELSPQTSLQAEYRYRNAETGDLRLRFFPDDFLSGLRNTEERNTYRLGGRHAFSPGSILLGSFIYQDADFDARNNRLAPPVAFIDLKRPESALSAELQHLFRSPYVNLTSGVGYFYIDGRLDTTTGVNIPTPSGPALRQIFSTASRDVQHTNVYAYSQLNPFKPLTLTVGLSANLLNDDRQQVGDSDEFNPKFGIIWHPFPATTVRAAAFRVLKRTLITNQTLEPTQVAGFNQFFDDLNGTEAWRYGGAIDQKFTHNIFGGVEFSKRDLNVPFLDTFDPANPIIREAGMDESLGRAYLFWTPHRALALRVQYIFERLESERTPQSDQPEELDTHRIPFGINVVHPSGLVTSLSATYFNQDGKFILTNGQARSGRDDFWTVDAAVGYRLPKRYGFITVGATNLFDERFRFFDRDLNNSSIQPSRVIFGRVTLALP
jgi:tetratricopeptide (TPR) repeat protein